MGENEAVEMAVGAVGHVTLANDDPYELLRVFDKVLESLDVSG